MSLIIAKFIPDDNAASCILAGLASATSQLPLLKTSSMLRLLSPSPTLVRAKIATMDRQPNGKPQKISPRIVTRIVSPEYVAGLGLERHRFLKNDKVFI
jgi:hypothetical protein